MFNENKISSSFDDIILCNGFTPTISVATHIKASCQRSCIDNILVNNPNYVFTSGVIDTQISHHRSLFLNYLLPKDNNVSRRSGKTGVDKIKYDFCTKNLDKVNAALSTKFMEEKQITNYESFISIFNKSLNDTYMLKSVKLSMRNIVRNPWITSGIINSITHRDNLYEKINYEIMSIW